MNYLKPMLLALFVFVQHFVFGQCQGLATQPTDDCAAAPFRCLKGVCWHTSAEQKLDPTKEGFCSNCVFGTVINNPQYFWFTAKCESVSFTISVKNFIGGEAPLQAAIIRPPTQVTSACDEWTCDDVLVCLNGFYIANLYYDDFVPGETYLLLIDGFNGAVCDYEILDISGDGNGGDCIETDYKLDEIQSSISGPSEACSGGSPFYQVDSVPDALRYKWFINGVFSSEGGYQQSIKMPDNLPDSSIVELCVYALNGCDSTTSVCREVMILKFPETQLADTIVCKSKLPVFYEYIHRVTKKKIKVEMKEGPNKFRFINQKWCDSIVNINLIVLENPDSSQIDTAICFQNGDEQWHYTGNVKNYYPGKYIATLKTPKKDCDSIVHLNIIGISINPKIKATGTLNAIYPKDRYVDMDGSEGISGIFPTGVYEPGAITYEWTLPNGSKLKNGGILRTYKPGKYVLTICATKYGVTCCESVTYRISATGTDTPKDTMYGFRAFVYVPNAFSPNGDGNNDVFRIYDNEQSILNINKVVVYDRSGMAVYEESNTTPGEMRGWGGTNKSGTPQKEGVYTYYIEVVLSDLEVKVICGNVTLFP